MREFIFPCVCLLATFVFTACEEKKPVRQVSPFVTVNMIDKNSRKCILDSVCAEVKLQYPILTGGDITSAVNAINDSLRLMALAGLEADPAWSAEQAFDSVQTGLYALLREHLIMAPEWTGGFFKEVKTNTLLNTSKLVSFEMSASGYTGGAHPSYSAVLSTYDLSTGKSVGLSNVVNDTTALRPMLEKGFLAAKKENPSDTIKLSDLLFPEIKQLPVSANFCIVPEGVRFLYNPYEVAPWAVGPTDITLTWEQLGRLADRKKWLE